MSTSASANQFARFSAEHGIDVFQVIEACNSQPFSHIHQPGIAVGGHCIPIYPRMYLWNDPEATVVRAASEANAEMPGYAAAQVEAAHGSLFGQRVAVLGAAYRGGVKETAFSGVFPLVAALRDGGARVLVHDPMYSDAELQGYGFDRIRRGTCIFGSWCSGPRRVPRPEFSGSWCPHRRGRAAGLGVAGRTLCGPGPCSAMIWYTLTLVAEWVWD
jgi:hypothetical protein